MATSFSFSPDDDYKVFVFLQSAKGELVLDEKYAAGTGESVAIGDVNGDGRNDVVTPAESGLGVLLQNASGKLDPMIVVPDDNSSLRVTTGDFNGDGRTDAAAIAWGSDQVSVFLQRRDGALASPARYFAPHDGYDDFKSGDLNGDGLEDIVVMSGQGLVPNFSVLTQMPGGGFAPPVSYRYGERELSGSVAIGDIDGNGRKDIALSIWLSHDAISPFLQDAQGVFRREADIGSWSFDTMEFADLTGDGLPDLVGAGKRPSASFRALPKRALRRLNLIGFPMPAIATHGLATGDVNGDGRVDVVLACYDYGLVVVLNDGGPSTPAFEPLPETVKIGLSVVRAKGEGVYATYPPDFGCAVTYWLQGEGVILYKGGAFWTADLQASDALVPGTYTGVPASPRAGQVRFKLAGGGATIDYDHATIEVKEAEQAGYYISRLHATFTLYDASDHFLAAGEMRCQDLPPPSTPTPTPEPTATPRPPFTPKPTPHKRGDRPDRIAPKITISGEKVRRTTLSYVILSGLVRENRELKWVKISRDGGAYRRANGQPPGWYQLFDLHPGRNVFKIRAMDASGNLSKPQRVVVVWE